ncbi:unnamed protein product [Symbiodinium necroappetens]|uniref:C3H1-type domain-containing protein n=1 Tax=Symbiodinium necroappetens TaxID=1628268 RepID=A0A812ZE90_9DINO|nr:unnamed protein product [Symbiodinium necroappetens]
MSTHGLSGVLDRTKTRGPGKRIRFLPIFISCKVFFMNPDWLQQGWSIWCSAEFQFERDYFLPLPNADGSAAMRSMATYARTLALSKQFLKLLRKPAWDGHTWQLSSLPLIEAEAALCFWTEHSERNWLVSVLASLGVPRDKRDYVGRWHIVAASDEYVRTARHVVLSLQEEALRGVCLDERWDLLNGGLEDLPSFLRERGCGERLVQSQSQALQLRSCLRVCLGPQHVRPNSASAADAPEVAARAPMPAILQAQAEELPPFYTAIVGKGRLRRLHRKGGCGTASRDLREMLPVFELQDAVYDSACKHCWRNGENPGEDAGDGAVRKFHTCSHYSGLSDCCGSVRLSDVCAIWSFSFGSITCILPACTICSWSFMADSTTDAAMMVKADSDLKFLMDDVGVPISVQLLVYRKGFTSVHVFAGVDDTRPEVRQALAKELPLHYTENAESRVHMALLLSVWDACRRQLSVTEKNRAESKLGVQDRVVQTSEYAAMRRAVEDYHGTLSDKELPSKSLLAQKLEQVEENNPVVEDLRDATSLEDAETEAYAAVIDPASSCLRIKPGRTMTVPPTTPEELRLRHRRLGLAWHMIRSKHTTRSWLPESIVDAFRRLSDFVLGDKVAGLKAEDGRVPKWSLILKFESELRKRAYQSVRDGAVGDLGAALKAACAAPDLFAFHFVTPFSLGGCAASPGGAGHVEAGAGWKGAGKGLDKKGDGKGKVMKTIAKHKWGPDGKLLCFRFQKKAGCPHKDCKFSHFCQRCLQPHSYSACPYVKRDAAMVDDGTHAPCYAKAKDPAVLEHGLRGHGAAMWSNLLGKRRRSSADTPSLAFAEKVGADLLKLLHGVLDVRMLAIKLAAGKVVACPFSAEVIEAGRELVFRSLESAGLPCMGERELFRTDARAEGNEVWIGGWALDHRDTTQCRWFSEKLTHKNAPWLFASGESYRQIASLELLATLAAVVLFGVPKGDVGRIRCSAGTDNLGNTHVVARLLTTSFPLCAFLMELATQLQRLGTELHLDWLPRLQNREADALTNGDFAGFSESRRRRFNLQDFEGIVLREMLGEGLDLYEDIRECRAAKRWKRESKLPAAESLRQKDPWQ